MATIESIRIAATLMGTGQAVHRSRSSEGSGFARLVGQEETPPGVQAPPGGKAGQTEGASPDVQTAPTNSPDSPPEYDSESEEPGDACAAAACPPYAAFFDVVASISYGQPIDAIQATAAEPTMKVALQPAEAAPNDQTLSAGGQLQADTPKFQVGTSVLTGAQAEALNITRVQTESVPKNSPNGDTLSVAESHNSSPVSTTMDPAPIERSPAPNSGAASVSGVVGQPAKPDGSPLLAANVTSGHEGTATGAQAEAPVAALKDDRSEVDVNRATSEGSDTAAAVGHMDVDAMADDSNTDRGGSEEFQPHPHSASALRHANHTIESRNIVAPEHGRPPDSGPSRIEIARQVIERLDSLVLAGAGRRVTLELEPHDLGRVSIRLLSFGNTMEAALVASDRSVGAALESAAPQLAAALRHRGIELASISVQHDATLDLSNGHSNRGHLYASDSDRRHANNLSLTGQPLEAPGPAVQRPILGSITELDVLA
jgi:flagellar hook-length control protein FliK